MVPPPVSAQKHKRLTRERIIGYYKDTGDRWCFMQDAPIKKYCRDSGYDLYKIYDDLDLLLSDLKEGDFYIMASMSQISHNSLDLINFWSTMKLNKCDFEILDLELEIKHEQIINSNLKFKNLSQIIDYNNKNYTEYHQNKYLYNFTRRLLDHNDDGRLNTDTTDELIKYMYKYISDSFNHNEYIYTDELK